MKREGQTEFPSADCLYKGGFLRQLRRATALVTITVVQQTQAVAACPCSAVAVCMSRDGMRG